MAPNGTILAPVNFDVSKVSFGAPKSLDNGGKIIPINYDGGVFLVQTPRMHVPYGVNRWDNSTERGSTVKLSVDLSFGTMDDAPADRAAFFGMMTALNKLFVDEAYNNSNAWFKKKYTSVDVIEALYTSLTKYSKDKQTGEVSHQYPPTFKLQLPQQDGVYKFQAYDSAKQLVDFDAIDLKGGEMVAIMQCSGVWVAGGKFGCTWRAVQIKVFPRASKLKAFAFVEDDDADYE